MRLIRSASVGIVSCALLVIFASTGEAQTPVRDQATLRQLGLQVEKRGATPERVREVQKALVETGYDPGPVDGRLGPRTKAALRRYASVPPPQAPTAAQQIIAGFNRANDRGQSP